MLNRDEELEILNSLAAAKKDNENKEQANQNFIAAEIFNARMDELNNFISHAIAIEKAAEALAESQDAREKQKLKDQLDTAMQQYYQAQKVVIPEVEKKAKFEDPLKEALKDLKIVLQHIQQEREAVKKEWGSSWFDGLKKRVDAFMSAAGGMFNKMVDLVGAAKEHLEKEVIIKDAQGNTTSTSLQKEINKEIEAYRAELNQREEKPKVVPDVEKAKEQLKEVTPAEISQKDALLNEIKNFQFKKRVADVAKKLNPFRPENERTPEMKNMIKVIAKSTAEDKDFKALNDSVKSYQDKMKQLDEKENQVLAQIKKIETKIKSVFQNKSASEPQADSTVLENKKSAASSSVSSRLKDALGDTVKKIKNAIKTEIKSNAPEAYDPDKGTALELKTNSQNFAFVAKDTCRKMQQKTGEKIKPVVVGSQVEFYKDGKKAFSMDSTGKMSTGSSKTSVLTDMLNFAKKMLGTTKLEATTTDKKVEDKLSSLAESFSMKMSVVFKQVKAAITSSLGAGGSKEKDLDLEKEEKSRLRK